MRKRFKEGEHVKVVNGIHTDETGLILNVVDNVVTILTDASMKTVRSKLITLLVLTLLDPSVQ